MADINLDDADLTKFNYKPELKRRLGKFGSFAFAFSAISVTLGIFSNYGYVLNQAGPVGIWTWAGVAMGQFLVALIFAEMGGRIPLSGYSYQWVGRLAGRGLGWFTGWAALCNMIIIVPTIGYIGAPIIANLLDLKNQPSTQITIAVSIVTAQFAINIFQVRLAAWLNNIATVTEIAGICGLIVFLLVAMAVRHQWHPELLLARTEVSDGSYWPHFLLAILLGAWALIGFESVADMSEETINPRRNVPRALLSSIAISAIIGFVALVVLTLAIPDLANITQSDTPILAIFESYWGRAFTVALMIIFIISIMACGMLWMAMPSRLIYAMARDNAFPLSSLLRRVSPAGVPCFAVSFVYAVTLMLTLFFNQLTSLISASSILFAVVYLVTVAAYALKAKTLPPTESFSLSRGRYVIITVALLWLLAEIGILTIPEEFHNGALAAGGVCLSGAILYWTVYRGRLKRL